MAGSDQQHTVIRLVAAAIETAGNPTRRRAFWFDLLREPNHLISTDVEDFGLEDGVDLEQLRGRSSLVRKTRVVMVECVVRGYLSGSGWKDYQASGCVSGIDLPPGLVESEKLPEPIFTPSTKATVGHDEPISFEQVVDQVGQETAEELRRRSLDIYRRGAQYAAGKGIIIADTKFEFGKVDDELILIDEVLTPDSSRFWPADQYEPARLPVFSVRCVWRHHCYLQSGKRTLAHAGLHVCCPRM